jgi:hypothetical protein
MARIVSFLGSEKEKKYDFELLEKTPNIAKTKSELGQIQQIATQKDLVSVIGSSLPTITHYSKEPLVRFLQNNPKAFTICLAPSYVLPAAYVKSEKQVFLNISYFSASNIGRVDYRNLYGLALYGFILYHVHGLKRGRMSEEYASFICDFLSAILIRVFGKKYGLLTSYSYLIGSLKFMVACYVLSSFFSIPSGDRLYLKASSMSGFSPDLIRDRLGSYDFSKITNFVAALSDFSIMPGISPFVFASVLFRSFGSSFVAALEDYGRFVSFFICSELRGSTIAGSFFSKFHAYSYTRISKAIEIIVTRL